MTVKTYKLPKIWTLNYRTWKCGQNDSDSLLGRGETALRNREGFMCCLGHAAVAAGVKCSNLVDVSFPDDLADSCDDDDVAHVILGLVYGYGKSNTRLSEKAANINDDEETTPAQKIVALKKLFKKHGYTMRVKNMPKSIAAQIRNLSRGK